ncbi:hypothetical protein HMPREF0663_11556 [Hoylesella oralis ATCC 33269]|uniref:Uncharacterized protein n=1 Tax=Hoylesella oralis ATCC 33269 TaxID=873533 RepID=E7RQV5_9BACT|nr:hypothetical protein [Hoylesella oralis]EFZ36643.1 hypothetical protein HMPREF0663_11556 [Hoylesella oralis ATCC 33269]EPH18377.1 hypothetical protein HMPREF1475_00913 [Hoylesella oralis HGA0225]SHG10549.1 hypothetical protein SAMN05444288_2366 [Hoylesella oralis]
MTTTVSYKYAALSALVKKRDEDEFLPLKVPMPCALAAFFDCD